MKITKRHLRQLIAEEVQHVLSEAQGGEGLRQAVIHAVAASKAADRGTDADVARRTIAFDNVVNEWVHSHLARPVARGLDLSAPERNRIRAFVGGNRLGQEAWRLTADMYQRALEREQSDAKGRSRMGGIPSTRGGVAVRALGVATKWLMGELQKIVDDIDRMDMPRP